MSFPTATTVTLNLSANQTGSSDALPVFGTAFVNHNSTTSFSVTYQFAYPETPTNWEDLTGGTFTEAGNDYLTLPVPLYIRANVTVAATSSLTITLSTINPWQ